MVDLMAVLDLLCRTGFSGNVHLQVAEDPSGGAVGNNAAHTELYGIPGGFGHICMGADFRRKVFNQVPLGICYFIEKT